MRAFLILAFLIVCAAAAAFFLWPNPLPVVDRVERDAPIVFFGDSLVAGVGATEESDVVSVLSRRIGRTIINAGRSGDTTATGLARLESDVLAHKPGLVIVLLGGNDALRKVPQAETFANLRAIVNRVRAQGAQVLLVGIRGSIVNDIYADEFSRLAEETDVAYVTDILSGLFGQARYMSDTIHPNNAGYAIMADRLEPILRLYFEE